ncbi:hypothetical protein LBMAG42_57380 [Deltaproteobacteria bacterium]|nr:hypothetical protein LBMAG42_57380 [Deltaproteobacteria bacterium]
MSNTEAVIPMIFALCFPGILLFALLWMLGCKLLERAWQAARLVLCAICEAEPKGQWQLGLILAPATLCSCFFYVASSEAFQDVDNTTPVLHFLTMIAGPGVLLGTFGWFSIHRSEFYPV